MAQPVSPPPPYRGVGGGDAVLWMGAEWVTQADYNNGKIAGSRFQTRGGKEGFGRDVYRLRARLSSKWRPLSQGAFAERFGLTLGLVKDAEQNRCKPSRALRVLIAAIDMEPEFMAKAAEVAAVRWPEGGDVP